jgi:HEAT repeat protein
MYQKPALPEPPVIVEFPEGLKPLWLRALERPEADLRRQAGDAIALAHRRGMKGLESTVGALAAALERPDQHPTVRLSVAHALVELDARVTADSLFRQAKEGDSQLRALVEPALARWDYRPAREVWLERLREPATPPGSLLLAIRGLGVVREGQAAARLLEMVHSEKTSAPTRLEAALALALIRDAGLEGDAERLAGDTSARGTVARLAAVSLLTRHQGEGAVRLLQRLARDPEPAVAAVAAGRLLALDPGLAVPVVEDLLANPDPKVRSLGVEVLFRTPSEKHVRLLGGRLDDLHPDVRVKARQALRDLAAQKNLRGPIIEEGTKMLASGSWRGLEQAAVLLTQLDHKPAADRLVELLGHERPEVFVAAGWGLRRLAVPETLPRVLSYVTAEFAGLAKSPRPYQWLDHQLSQLNQLLGDQKYRPAHPTLHSFVPYPPKAGPEARAAAVWALGVIHEGETDTRLEPLLEERLKHTGLPLPPEDNRVRRMCAITLGRLKAKDTLPSLRRYFWQKRAAEDPVNNACGWAIEQITGERMLPPEPIRKPQRDWFLSPTDGG